MNTVETRGVPVADGDADRDDELARVLDGFLRAIETGDAPSPERLIAQHPAIADRLRACLASLQIVGQMGRSEVNVRSEMDARPPDQTAGPAEQLGDYRVIRQIGRGGMGVVYEAEQVSLGRRVALKVLPFASALDHRQLQRFKIEAHAAALLHHTNIVPVFSVGSERGVHYFAMQFIDGRTLAAVIAELRSLAGKEPAKESIGDVSTVDPSPHSPHAAHGRREAGIPPRGSATSIGSDAKRQSDRATTAAAAGSLSTDRSNRSPEFFRTVAQLGLQAAEALEHAHQNGIVHRDIKPANLLIDERRNLWVTDFGLARFGEDTGLTMSGDMLGTLRYMSPEQAMGRRCLIDHRTDIYSLAATLYELLTLQPVFDGQDRQELLRQIAFDEPRPITRVNQSVPAELETIVHKALAKNPAERFDTAQEFADDLRRFLEDRPIHARRPSIRQRVAKFARRHRAVVQSLAGAFVVLAIVSSISAVSLWQERGRTNDALKNEARQRERAEVNLELARRAAEEMYFEVADKWKPADDEMLEMQRQFLRRALAFYEEFAERNRDEPDARQTSGEASLRAGEIHWRLDDYEKAEHAFRQALETLDKLDREHRDRAETRYTIAYTLNRLYEVLIHNAEPREAEVVLERSISIYRQLAADFPDRTDYRLSLAASLHTFAAKRLVEGNLAAAEQLLRESLGIAEKLHAEQPEHDGVIGRVGGARSQLASVFRSAKRYDEAERLYRENLAMFERLSAQQPAVPRWFMARMTTHRYLAELAAAGGKQAKSAEEWGHASGLLDRIAGALPNEPQARDEVSAALTSMAANLGAAGRNDGTDKTFGLVVSIQEQLIAKLPAQPEYRVELAKTLGLHADYLNRTGRPTEAEAISNRIIETYRQLAKEFPSQPNHQIMLALTSRDLGIVLGRDNNRREHALKQFNVAIVTCERLVAEFPNRVGYQQELALMCEGLGGLERNLRGDLPPTPADLRCLEIRTQIADQHPDDFQSRAAAAESNLKFAFMLRNTKPIEAVEALNRSVGMYEKLVHDYPGKASYHHGLSNATKTLSQWLLLNGDLNEARRRVEQGIERADEALRLQSQNANYRTALADGHLQHARVLVRSGEHAGAAAAVEKSLPQTNFFVHFDLMVITADCAVLARKDANLPDAERTAAAQRYVARNKELLEESVALAKEDGIRLGRIAWFLATSAEPAARDPQRAVELAGKAMEFSKPPANNAFTAHLGVAHYRAGDWQSAAKLLAEAEQKAWNRSADALFFQAMAHQQLGNPDTARACFDRAIAAANKVSIPPEQTGRFRAEAASLLGLADSATAAEATTSNMPPQK